MAGEIRATIVGNITADPELRFTTSGIAVANFTIASNVRTFDKLKSEWVDGNTSFIRVNVWRQLAENVVETLVKGNRVIAYGTLEDRTWEDDEDVTRHSFELTAESVGAELTWATATVVKTVTKAPVKPAPAKPRSRALRK